MEADSLRDQEGLHGSDTAVVLKCEWRLGNKKELGCSQGWEALQKSETEYKWKTRKFAGSELRVENLACLSPFLGNLKGKGGEQEDR